MHGLRSTLPENFQKGLQSFNRREFYAAHEHFENAWRQTPGDEREFYRAFLHLSGGFYRLSQNRPGAAQKFFTHADKWFAAYPDDFYGFNVSRIRQYLHQLISSLEKSISAGEILRNQFQTIHDEEGCP